jgi:DNA-binding transcriptional ArsR family regulator
MPTRQRATLPVSKIFSALADPMRLEILRTLLEHDGELECGQFRCPLAKSTLSHHYKVLRAAGLVQSRSEGRRQLNSVDLSALDARLPGLGKVLRNLKDPL